MGAFFFVSKMETFGEGLRYNNRTKLIIMKKGKMIYMFLAVFVFKALAICAIIMMLSSCGSNSNTSPKPEKVHTGGVSKIEKKEMDINPAFYLGSDFGNYFQVLYRQEKYDMMLSHTSKESVNKHGEENIIALYRDMQFAHRIELDNMNTTSDSTYTMNYVINQMATRKMWRLKIAIEEGDIKVVLPDDLNDFLK